MKVITLLLCIAFFAAQALCATWPTATGSQAVTAKIAVSGTLDGGNKRYYGSGNLGGTGQDEDQDPIFELADGATLKNVIIGTPAADGVHCKGSCTLNNVWWEDVGEDAATFKGTSSGHTGTVTGGGAKKAADKVFQHNGAGTVKISNFELTDFGKLYRSCGNCKTQYKRTVAVENVVVIAPGKTVVGINSNYGDKATIRSSLSRVTQARRSRSARGSMVLLLVSPLPLAVVPTAPTVSTPLLMLPTPKRAWLENNIYFLLLLLW